MKSTYPQDMFTLTYEDGTEIYFEHGEGAYLFDRKGRKYLDLWNGFGSVLLGHSDNLLRNVMNDAINSNKLYMNALTPWVQETKEFLLDSYRPMEQVAFFTTGTDAVRAAVNAIRRQRKKQIILSAGYHGWDSLWELSETPFIPNQYGVIDFYFILEKLKELVMEYKDKIAAIVISPDMSYFSLSYYDQLFAIAKEQKIPVIVDDVKCGYRYQLGPSLEYVRYHADLYIVSKGIANGARISAVMGKNEIMSYFESFCYTSFFDMYSMLSANITLRKLKMLDAPQRICHYGDQLISKLKESIQKVGIPIDITGNGNLFQFVLYHDELNDLFYQEATNEGIILYKNDNQCPSLSFGKHECNFALEKFQKIFDTLASSYPDILGSKVPANRYHKAAFYQADGCMEQMEYEEKIQLINNMLYKKKER